MGERALTLNFEDGTKAKKRKETTETKIPSKKHNILPKNHSKMNLWIN
jgi:hypothetical protein